MHHAYPSGVRVTALDAGDLPRWLALPGAPFDDHLAQRVHAAWASGEGGPGQTFLLQRDGVSVGRVAYLATPAASSLPGFLEARTVGLWLPWDDPDVVALGARLVSGSIAALPDAVRAVDATVNAETTPIVDLRLEIFAAAGLRLFQEKLGFEWRRDDPPAGPPSRRPVMFRPVDDVGEASLIDVMDRATVGTLDRQDAYYAALVGPGGWGREMLAYSEAADRPDWLVAFDERSSPVGYVLLGTFDGPDRGTIVHIGVVPEARGRGLVHELLEELTKRARRRGFATVLSDCDTLNRPMQAALERAGHRAANTAWHVWHHRLER